MKVKADAEAYYNRTVAASLSPVLIKQNWIDKWDGDLPKVTGNSGGLILDLTKE